MKILVYLILPLILFAARPAMAHISRGYIPDPVAEMQYRILLDFQPEKNDVRNKLGMVLYRMGKISEAETEFNTVLTHDPKNFNATDALGLIMLKRRQFATAVKQFKEALALKPSDVMVYYHLGLAYRQLKKLILAKDALQTALTKSALPGQPPLTKEIKDALLKVRQVLRQVKDDLSKQAGKAAVTSAD